MSENYGIMEIQHFQKQHPRKDIHQGQSMSVFLRLHKTGWH